MALLEDSANWPTDTKKSQKKNACSSRWQFRYSMNWTTQVGSENYHPSASRRWKTPTHWIGRDSSRTEPEIVSAVASYTLRGHQ